MTFQAYAEDYLAWSRTVHRAQRTAKYEVGRLVSAFGSRILGEITPADVEQFVRKLSETLAPPSINRLRDRLSGMMKRARRLGLITTNPVSGVAKLREAGSRLAFVSPIGEAALLGALPIERHALVILAINTGLRWSEEAALRWRDIDVLSDFLTVRLGKNGQARRVPLNRAARAALVDQGARRQRTDDPEALVFRAYRTVSREFVRAVGLAGCRCRLHRPGQACNRRQCR
jgi:integrase